MKAVLENTTSLASCTIISSMPFSPETHTCSQAYAHMHTNRAHVFLHIQLLISLTFKLILLRNQLGHLWLVCGNMHSMCQWPPSEMRAFLSSSFKVAAAVLCSFLSAHNNLGFLHYRDIKYSGHAFGQLHSCYGSLLIRITSSQTTLCLPLLECSFFKL